MRGRGLPVCGCGVTVPTSTKPNPRPSSASGTSPCLSKPAAMPIGLGKFRPKARTARRGSSGVSLAWGGIFSARTASRWASSGSSSRRSGRAQASRRPITAPVPVRMCRPSAPSGSGLVHCTAASGSCGIEVGEQRAAARDFPFQFRPKPFGIDRHQHQVRHAGEVPGGRLGHLPGRREMNESVAQIDRRAGENAGTNRRIPQRTLADFIDGLSSPSAPSGRSVGDSFKRRNSCLTGTALIASVAALPYTRKGCWTTLGSRL